MSGLEIPTAIAIGSAAVGTGTSLFGAANQSSAAKMRAREESYASEFEAQQHSIEEQNTRTAAMQAEAKRRSDLTSSLETIMAIRGSRGLATASPTAAAVLGNMTEDAERDIAIERNNYLQRAERSRMAAELSRRRGRYSLLAGELGSTAAWTSGIGNAAANIGKVASLGGPKYGGGWSY